MKGPATLSHLVAVLFLVSSTGIPTFNHYFISDSLDHFGLYRLERVEGSETGEVETENQTVTYVYRKDRHDHQTFSELQQLLVKLEKETHPKVEAEHSELGAILSNISGNLIYGLKKVDDDPLG
ncbi:MucBP domain-containing protein [Enterococcus sp. CSURQ0835]|uniref:MucBP domain-containing protein n=1 Tax=Enterococcus sp. CSURQ0835 TaxID=2681394 RepID=UPI001357F399|nr:MucBP domain-containing protein [Enterococcus sp. CSURQ0835]